MTLGWIQARAVAGPLTDVRGGDGCLEAEPSPSAPPATGNTVGMVVLGGR